MGGEDTGTTGTSAAGTGVTPTPSTTPAATPSTTSTPLTPVATPTQIPNTLPVSSTQAYPTQESTYNPRQAIENVQKDVQQVNYFMVGVVVFIAVSFLISMYTTSIDRISDKTLYLQYDTMYQQYSDKNSAMSDEINQQQITIDNLQNQLQLLKASNPYLK